MPFTPLPFRSRLREYEQQAEELLGGWQANDPGSIEVFRQNHPRFLEEKIPWLPRNLSDAEIRSAALEMADAQLAIARAYSFQSWPRFVEWIESVRDDQSPVARFEASVEAVLRGDTASLGQLLADDPDLVRTRSTVVTNFDPPVHRATLLHYIAANGVENYRQVTPTNAVAVARQLLDAGAEVDALAEMYGGRCTTMSMLVSSSPPAHAGVQVDLVNVLLDYGASLEARGEGKWTSPLLTALVFGFSHAAEALTRRGAPVNQLAVAAGLGRLAETRDMLTSASAHQRHLALALAAQLGHPDIVALLLDAGEDPNRYNPDECHAHATPLHHAVWFNHPGVVRLLVEHGARLDLRDRIYDSTPLGWAEFGGRSQIATYLRTMEPASRGSASS